MTRTILLQPTALVSGGTLAAGPHQVLVRDGTVEAIGVGLDRVAGLAFDEHQNIEGTLLPGLIDLQVNGAGGRSVDEGSPEALDTIARAARAGGAAAFLPTLITAPFERLLEQLRAVAAWIEAGPPEDGAEPLGIHLEGPFLETSGAHDDEQFCDPTPERIDAVLDAAAGYLALVTLAPARNGAARAIARLRGEGVAVALGHADSPENFTECVDAGANLVTHLFNAMSPLHHRSPGIAGLALDDPRLYCSLIVDGVHVDPVMVRNAVRCIGLERTVLVTDAVAPAGMPDGTYELAGKPIEHEHGVVRDRDGRPAGSALTMAEAASNFIEFAADHIDVTDRPSCEVLAEVCALNPSLVLETGEFGDIAPGHRAVFTRMTDSGDLEVLDPQ